MSVLLIFAAAILAVTGGSGDGASTVVGIPRLVTVAEAAELEDSLDHPVYWAGERSPNQLEIKQETGASVYLRYLPTGTEAGDPRAAFLTVGTYPVLDAQAALRRAGSQAGTAVEALASGAIVLPNPASEGSVYLAYPDSDLEIEVYDPTPGRAMELIRSGEIRPVGEG